jgi:replicative DNA helicase
MTDRDIPGVRAIPWSQEAEQSLLGGLLLDNAAFDRIGDVVKAGDFYSPEHRAIYAAISELIVSHKPADVVTVFERLQSGGQADQCGGVEYLNRLSQSVPSAHNARRYAEIVREKALQREVQEAAGEAQEIAAEAGPVLGKLDRITARFMGLLKTQVRKIPKAISELAIRRTEFYEELQAGRLIPGWATQIPVLNRLLLGGLRPGLLYILAARPSVGKSSLAEAIGLHLARAHGLCVLFLSQEMGEDELTDRAVSHIGRVSYESLQIGLMSDEDWGRVAEAMDAFSGMDFHVDDQPALTLSDIRIKAMQVKPKVLIVDYLQLCASTLKGGNRNQEVGEISRGLKSLAKELDCAVIALSQLNRSVETRQDKRPTQADLRDSGEIEQDADVIAFLWPLGEEGDIRYIGGAIDKNRRGKKGDWVFAFDGDRQHWGESTLQVSGFNQRGGGRHGRQFDE